MAGQATAESLLLSKGKRSLSGPRAGRVPASSLPSVDERGEWKLRIELGGVGRRCRRPQLPLVLFQRAMACFICCYLSTFAFASHLHLPPRRRHRETKRNERRLPLAGSGASQSRLCSVLLCSKADGRCFLPAAVMRATFPLIKRLNGDRGAHSSQSRAVEMYGVAGGRLLALRLPAPYVQYSTCLSSLAVPTCTYLPSYSKVPKVDD